MYKIAICDDDKNYREKIEKVIETEGFFLRARYGFMNTSQERNYWKMLIFCMIWSLWICVCPDWMGINRY